MSQVDDEEARSEAVFDGVLQTLEQDYSHIGIPETLNALAQVIAVFLAYHPASDAETINLIKKLAELITSETLRRRRSETRLQQH